MSVNVYLKEKRGEIKNRVIEGSREDKLWRIDQILSFGEVNCGCDGWECEGKL